MGPSHWLIGKLCIFVDGMVTAFTIDKPKLKMGHTLYAGYADNLHGPSLNHQYEVTTHFVDIFRKPLCKTYLQYLSSSRYSLGQCVWHT